MNVSQWTTPAAYFAWPHVQDSIDAIDAQVYRNAIAVAQAELGEALPCPTCGRASQNLFWVSVASPEAEWDAGRGQVGFLTICSSCQAQTDFLVDPAMTELQAEQWRLFRELY